ncbi:MAG TPA: MCE family protein [Aeromicrobium sp.]|nr:MCE family protein [Aeromicrobium sp.]
MAIVSSFRKSRLLQAAVVVLLAIGAWAVVHTTARQVFTVYFADATKLHVGDKVTVLDVPVGKVLTVTPERDRVRVRIEVTEQQKIPSDANATIVAPTMVSVRHLELSPAYDGGPSLADGASIPMSRTAGPVEWDEVQRQFTRFAEALGPDGANRKGALSELLTSAAANLDGQGRNLGDTLVAISDALRALSDHRGDLFATVRNLDVFVKALASSDETIRLFTERLTDVSGQLSDDSDVLVAALDRLGGALTELNRFLRTNSAATGRTVTSLQQFTHNLADHRQKVADILQAAPTALSNYYNTYYPDAPAMTGTFVGAFLDSPAVFICSSLYSLGGTPSDCEALLAPIAQFLQVPVNPIGINPLERNGGDGAAAAQAGVAAPTPATVAATEPGGTGQGPVADTVDLLGSLMLGLVP